MTDERELVEAARSDANVFGQLFDRYYDQLFAFALRRTGNIASAEDVVAETFLKAFSKLWQFRWKGLPFSAWLYRIASNEINMLFRRRGNTNHSLEAMLEADASQEPADTHNLEEELIEAEESYARLRMASDASHLLSCMPPLYADALSLRFFEEKSVSEIAHILGKPEGTVKSLLSRGIGKLRELILSQPDIASRIPFMKGDSNLSSL